MLSHLFCSWHCLLNNYYLLLQLRHYYLKANNIVMNMIICDKITE